MTPKAKAQATKAQQNNNWIAPHQTKEFLHSKGNNNQSEEITHTWRKYLWLLYDKG